MLFGNRNNRNRRFYRSRGACRCGLLHRTFRYARRRRLSALAAVLVPKHRRRVKRLDPGTIDARHVRGAVVNQLSTIRSPHVVQRSANLTDVGRLLLVVTRVFVGHRCSLFRHGAQFRPVLSVTKESPARMSSRYFPRASTTTARLLALSKAAKPTKV